MSQALPHRLTYRKPYIAVARYLRKFLGKSDDPRFPELERRGHQALGVMEQHLAGADRKFFAGDHLTIADLCLFAYTCVADQGGFDLAPHPKVRAWLDRCRATPGLVDTPSP